MSDLKIRRCHSSLYACYDDQGEVSPERTRALVQYFIDKGVQGLYVNGSSGECIYQSVEDRKLILEEVHGSCKGKLIYYCSRSFAIILKIVWNLLATLKA